MMAEKPNILFIMADDHAPHALSCYGSRINRTPNLDRLAEQGIRFTNCFDTVSLCTPSRASLLTGKYSHKTNVMRLGDNFDGSQQTFPKILQQVGYETAMIGKWHLGTQPTGFDYYNVMANNGQGQYWDCPMLETGAPWDEGVPIPGYVTDIVTDLSINWLEERDREKPFCLLLHHKAPHQPYNYPEKYGDLYREDLPYPETFLDDHSSKGVLREGERKWSKLQNMVEWDLAGDELGDTELPSREDPEAFKEFAYQTVFKGYLRLVASLDDNVGRMLDYLDRSGLSRNTLVIYTSDNGYFLGDHGLYNKMWMYEESIGLPVIARLPGEITAGSINDEFTSIVDFAPTFLDYAGVTIPDDIQGQSIRELLENHNNFQSRDVHYYHYYNDLDVPNHCGIRTRHHKLICYYESDPKIRWELYDLDKDRQEMKNVCNTLEYLKVFTTLKKLLVKTQVELEDPAVERIQTLI